MSVVDSIAEPKENIPRAIVLTLVVIAILGLQDALSKVLVQTHSPFQVTMMRYWAFAAFSLLLVSRKAPLRQALRSRAPWQQVLRGLLLMSDIWLFALALQSVPLAELQALSLIYPLLVTLFAVPILGERFGVFRLGAVGVGFVGAMVIVRPGGLPLNLGAAYAVGSSALYALYIIMTRRVGKIDAPATSMVYVSLIGLVLSGVVGVFYWTPMNWTEIGLIVILMLTTTLGHGLMMLALSMAPASVLQPFNYFLLPWAICLSFVIFGHLIDPISLMGAAIVVGAGLVVVARERIRRVPHLEDVPPH